MAEGLFPIEILLVNPPRDRPIDAALFSNGCRNEAGGGLVESAPFWLLAVPRGNVVLIGSAVFTAKR